MDKIIKKIVYLILALQEKFMRKKHKKAIASFTNSTSKTVMTNGCSLNLTVKTEENKAKLENNVATILKKFENMPEKIRRMQTADANRSDSAVAQRPVRRKIHSEKRRGIFHRILCGKLFRRYDEKNR